MKGKVLLFLLTLVIAFGAYIHFGIEKKAEQKEQTEKEENALVQSPFDEWSEIEIKTAAHQVLLSKDESGWRMKAPFDDIVSDTKISSFKNALKDVVRKKKLYSEDELKKEPKSLSNFGLQPSKIDLKLKSASNTVQLNIGSANPTRSGVYAMSSRFKGDLFLASQELDYLELQSADEWREKKLITVEDSDFEEMKIEVRGEKLNFKKENNLWKLTSSPDLPVDQEAVKGLANKIGYIRANEFVENSNALKGKSPDIKLTIGFKEGVKDKRAGVGDKRPEGAELLLYKVRKPTIKLAKTPDDYDYFAIQERTPPSKVARYHFDNFNKSHKDYIERKSPTFAFADVEKVEIFKKGKLESEIISLESGYQLKSKGIEEVGDSVKIEQSLAKIRNLSGKTFIKKDQLVVFDKADLGIVVSLKNKSTIKVALQFDKSEDFGWFLMNGQFLKYSLEKDSLPLNEFDVKSWKLPKKEEGTKK